MATNLATAYVEIIPSAKGIGSAISQELSGVEPKATSHGSKIGSKLSAGLKSAMKKGALGAGAAAGATLGRALQKGFGRLNAIEQARAKLSTLADSAADVDAAMDSVTKAVTGTAFATSEAADAAAMAMAAGIKPGREMTGVLSTIADAASFSNKEFSEVAPIFTKAINKGKVMGDTLMQLEENSIPATQALARHLGKTGEEIQEMASKGQISFKDLQEAMDKTIGGQAQAQGETFTGALKNVDAALGRFGETLLATPFKMGPQIFSALGKSIDDVNTKVKAGIEYLQTGVDTEGYMFKAFGTREQADEVMAMLDDVRQNWSEFQSGLRGEDASGLFGALGGSLREIGQAAADIMPALMDVGMSLGEAGMTASIVSITGALGVVAPLLADVLAPILQTVGDLMRENQGVVNALVTAFVGFKTVDAAAGGLAKVASSGGKLQKMFKGLGPAIKGSASGITGFAKVAKSGFLSATRGLKMFQGAFKMGQMGRSLKSVSGAVGKLGLSFGKASVYAKMAGKAITSGLVKGLKLAVGGIKALGMAIAANPIGLLVTAIAAVVAGLVYFFTQTETGKRLWASFMEFMGQVWENIKTWAQAAWDWIVQVWNGIPEWFSEKWNSVTGIVSQAWEGIKTAISNAWNAITEWFAAAWEAYKAQVQANWEFVKSIFSAAWEGIKNIVILAWNGIQTFFTTAWTIFTSLVQTVWNGIVLVFQTVWNVIKTVVTTVWNGIAAFFSAAWATFTSIVTTVWNTILTIIQGVWDGIKNGVTTIWNAISSFISGAWSAFTGFVSSTWENIKNLISNAWEAIKATTQAVWEAIKTAIANAVQAMVSKLQEFASSVKAKIDEAWNHVKQFPQNIRNAFSNAGSWLVNAGKAIIQGLINGIKSMAGTVGNAIRSILPGAVQGLISLGDGGIALVDGGITAYANGGIRRLEQYANGGHRREKHVAQIANAGDWRLWAEPETGGEAYIPLARSKRGRSTAILNDVAKIFGLQLVDNDGNRVDATTPGGTGPKGSAVRAFANGGIRTAAEVRRFVEGDNVAGVQAERSLQGAPYENFPGRDGAWGDCSYTQGNIAAFMLGLNPWPRKFSTSSQLSWLRSNGANIGMGPEGSYRVGWYDNGGGQFGHTSGTLPDGTNVEMGGGNGGGAIGGGAVPWNHPQFTHHAWIPAAPGYTGPTGMDDAVAEVPEVDFSDTTGGSATATTSTTAATGSDPNMVPLDDDVAAKAEQAGMVDTSTTGEATTWSDAIGDMAKAFVSGHIKDILGVFGIPDEIPPIIVAARKMFVQATQGDPDGQKAQQQIEDAADAQLEAQDAVVDVEAEPVEIDSVPTGAIDDNASVADAAIEANPTPPPPEWGEGFFAHEIARAAIDQNFPGDEAPFDATQIALATALVESGDPMLMYANNAVPESLQYRHDAVGSDHDSVGLFQQRDNGAWGTVAQRMNPYDSAVMFYRELKKFDWQSMQPGDAAQKVQRSAFPDRYATKLDKAGNLAFDTGYFVYDPERNRNLLKSAPGFKKGGMVYGGNGKNLDDVLAWLSQGEMVINSDSVDADPDMAKTLNDAGPDAVRDQVLRDAVGGALNAVPEFKLSGSMRDMLAQNLYGASNTFSQLASMGVAAGFQLAGTGARSALTAGAAGADVALAGAGITPSMLGVPGLPTPPSVAGMAGMVPIEGLFGVAGDVASWYTGKVTSGIGNALAEATLGVYDIGVGQVEEVMNAFGMNRLNPAMIAENSELAELRGVLEDSVQTRFSPEAGYGTQPVGDTYVFNASDFGQMQSLYRREKAKKGKVGAR
ncbi:tape measure protein [Corynebacterium amycolatum]|uniref:tape measure protein n=1 Tax=Corynebacterium TaxID=1716 RepID=UPI0008A83D83|nr:MULTISPECIES: tape measure protein [unclassified Corynebacterium]MBC6767329.1 hypothetical protein [Corynebacterium sp. LK15]OHR25533.1 hypothetical protein HMPREF2899_04545 [Corynebacterium sp. HMSC072D01]TXS79401.1 hypothetical protein CHU72_08525 [Corynebacterium sp. LK12]